MIKTLLVLLCLFLFVCLGVQLHGDPGYVLIVLRHWSVESTVWVLLGAILVAFTLLHFLFVFYNKTMHLPSFWQDWRGKRRAQRAHNKTTQGLIEFTEGYWDAATKHLIQALPNTETPLINYLIAARAAQELGKTKQRDHYLREAQQSMPDAKIAVELTQAQLQIAHQQWEQALATLRHLKDLAPNHPYVLKLLARLYEAIQDWPELVKLLSELKRHHVLSDTKLSEITHRAYLGAEKHYIQQQQWETLDTLLEQLPKPFKHDPELIAAYAKALIAQQEHTHAEACLRRALQKNVDPLLLEAYGLLDASSLRVHTIESLLKQHNHKAAIHRCLGELYQTQKLWGKAQSHFEQSLTLEPSPKTYALLGDLLESLDDSSGAFDAYQAGLAQALKIKAHE